MSTAILLFSAIALCLPYTSDIHAQFWGGPNAETPPPPGLEDFPKEKFTFCTIAYSPNGYHEPLGFGWNTDYPDSGHNFMLRLSQLTTIEINTDDYGDPIQEVIRLTDPTLFNYPYIFMSDVGTATFSKKEAEALREYLVRGGLLHVDDFWGDDAWINWEAEIYGVLSPDEYDIIDIPLDHEIFHVVFDVTEIPQVPSIQHWYRSGGSTTSERGLETEEPHFRGIFDQNGRLMVLMTHNTDIADGWEKERENLEYFQEFSVKKSYPIGINIVVYAMTH
ncbi:MAG: DUF4159 domain-containing protein [Candidatus Hydrogenedentota bacterium]